MNARRKQPPRIRPLPMLLALPALLILLTVQFSYSRPRIDRYIPSFAYGTPPPCETLPPEHLLNAGDLDALDALPGVGPVTAQRIIDLRDEIGHYRSTSDLLFVNGIGESTLADIEKALATDVPSATPTLPPDHLLNTGDLDALDELPGIGPALAQRIIDARESSGPFTSLDDLLTVEGIGPKKLADIRESLTHPETAVPTVVPAAPTLPPDHLLNTGDLDALDELPGIGPALAQRIIDARESSGPFTSLDDLLAVEGIGPQRLDAIRNALNALPTPTPQEESP